MLVAAAAFACTAAGLAADELPNPFLEMAEVEQNANRRDANALARLVKQARRLQLYGHARKYARELLQLMPDDEPMRSLLYQKKFMNRSTDETVWLDWFDAAMWQSQGLVRDDRLGYVLPADREAAQKGLIRIKERGLLPIGTWDGEHSEWARARELDCRFFHIRFTVPWIAAWYVADDLDRLTLAYLDYFEIDRLPRKRFLVHLYRTEKDADAAGADGKLLRTYGAYYSPQQKILHVPFDSVGDLTAARHEAAHALNREFVAANPPQWFDEGVGVMCQFAQPTEDGWFEFGRFPRHGFGLTFLEEVKRGARERMADVHRAGYVTMNSHYYSKFRSLIDFFMTAEAEKYRLTFINAMFRHQGDVEHLLTLPDIDAQWTDYVQTLKVDPHWSWRPYPAARTRLVEHVLEAGTSAAAFPVADPQLN